jgi:hypothetical protein
LAPSYAVDHPYTFKERHWTASSQLEIGELASVVREGWKHSFPSAPAAARFTKYMDDMFNSKLEAQHRALGREEWNS